MKESLAVAVFLLNYNNLKENRLIKYYILVTISILFHLSAVILLFFPLFRFIRLNWYFFTAIIIAIGLFSIADEYLYFFEGFERINDKVGLYVNSTVKLNIDYIIYSLLRYSIFPLLILLAYKKYYKKSPGFEFLICLNIIVGAGVVFYPAVFSRFTNYTMPFVSLFFADFFAYTLRNKFYSVILFCGFMVIYGFYYFQPLPNRKKMYDCWVPYSSIYEPKSYRQIEDFFSYD